MRIHIYMRFPCGEMCPIFVAGKLRRVKVFPAQELVNAFLNETSKELGWLDIRSHPLGIPSDAIRVTMYNPRGEGAAPVARLLEQKLFRITGKILPCPAVITRIAIPGPRRCRCKDSRGPVFCELQSLRAGCKNAFSPTGRGAYESRLAEGVDEMIWLCVISRMFLKSTESRSSPKNVPGAALPQRPPQRITGMAPALPPYALCRDTATDRHPRWTSGRCASCRPRQPPPFGTDGRGRGGGDDSPWPVPQTPLGAGQIL
eukprot:gene2638-biopygen20058